MFCHYIRALNKKNLEGTNNQRDFNKIFGIFTAKKENERAQKISALIMSGHK